MGRYESQRAIAARTISERRNAGKASSRKRHGGWLAWFIGRVTALALTVAALGAVASHAPRLWRPPATTIAQPAPAAKFGKAPFAAKLTAQAGAGSAPNRQGVRRNAVRRAPAATAPAEPGYQVLTPDELAAISQAR